MVTQPATAVRVDAFAPMPAVTIRSVELEPLSVPLAEPFVIATGRMDVTRAVLVRATLVDGDGRRAVGLGEAAALPPVTREDQPDLLVMLTEAAPALVDARLGRFSDATTLLGQALPGSALARALGAPTGARSSVLITDITLPISSPAHMAATAVRHRAAGFSCFKVKVGRDWRTDRASLRAVALAIPDARFRLDANAGFTPGDALALLDAALADGLTIECFEQPCATEDLDGMAQVTAQSPVPVVADESFRDAGDLDRLIAAGAADAVNLKLVKLGGPLTALALGRRARAAGMRLMAGAMVETRVGLLAMAHVVAALGGVDWVDLDTAFLLADDPFAGGWTVTGPRIELEGAPGLGVWSR